MKLRHAIILVAWTAFVLVATGGALFFFTYGDCFDSAACVRTTNLIFWLILGIAALVYWIVTLTLARKWNRDVF